MIKELTIHRFKRFSDQTFKFIPNSLTLIVGGNNSGKSTILHAFAVWEFCKLIVKIEKGAETLLINTPKPGLGLNADEFLPIAIPSLN
ncbi:MAG TPA: AAA family ATPase, partial [Tenuifilaceae bacterium]|nr:AAA family ATPase [Tenuifilaceae bacterium]